MGEQQDFLELIESNAGIAAPGVTRLRRRGGVIQLSADGGSFGAMPFAVLPPAWANSFKPLGDSQTGGLLATTNPPGTLTNNITSGGTTNQLDNWTSLATYATDAAAIRNAIYQLGQKINALGSTRMSFSGDGTGTYRSHLVELCWSLGIPITNRQWMRGSLECTDPNLQGGGNVWDHHEGWAGYPMVGTPPNDLNSKFVTTWVTSFQAQSILLMAGTNDWANWLAGHAGDYAGAAAAAAANLSTLLATIKSTAAAGTVVGFVTPPTGTTHMTEALLSVPLFKQAIAAAVAGGQRVYLVYDASTAFAPQLGPTNLMLGDDIHLNELGQRMLAGGILRGMLACPY